MTATTLANLYQTGESDIIAIQLKPVCGDGMEAKVYAHRPTVCHVPGCGHRFAYPKLKCPVHQTRPDYIRVQISGVAGYPGGLRLYSNQDGDRLTVYNTGAFMDHLNRLFSRGSFRARDFEPAQKGRLIISRFKEIYLADLKRRASLSPDDPGRIALSSEKDYRLTTENHVVSGLGKHKLDELSPAIIRKWLQTINEPVARKKAHYTLRHLISYAVHEEEMGPPRYEYPALPGLKKGVKRHKRRMITLTRIQQEEIISAVSGRTADHVKRHKLLLLWLAITGRRINEARALQVQDIKWNQGECGEYIVQRAFDQETLVPIIKVAGTTGAVIPLTAEQRTLLREALEGRIYGPDSFVFVNPNQGLVKPYTHGALAHIFESASKRAGYALEINEFGRHSWATQKINEGWSFKDVAIFLLDRAETIESCYANVTSATRLSTLRINAKR